LGTDRRRLHFLAVVVPAAGDAVVVVPAGVDVLDAEGVAVVEVASEMDVAAAEEEVAAAGATTAAAAEEVDADADEAEAEDDGSATNCWAFPGEAFVPAPSAPPGSAQFEPVIPCPPAGV